MWYENNLSIFSTIYSESIFKEDENNNVKQVKDIFSSLIQKEKNKEEIYFKDYQKAVKDFLEKKKREIEEMQEIIKDSHIEEKLSEYKEKMKDYKQSVEELKKYYKEKNNKN